MELIDIARAITPMFPILGLSASNIPTDSEFKVLWPAIKNTFPEYSIHEIIHAFNLGLKGKLNPLLFKINLFDKPFSVAYISDLLNAYREYKSSSMNYKKSLNNIDSINKDADSIEIFNNLNKSCIETYNMICEGKINQPDHVMYIDYNHLKKGHGLFTVTQEEIDDAIKQAKISLNKNAKRKASVYDIAKGNIPKSQLDKQSKREIENQAKAIIIYNFYQSMKESKKELILKNK